VQNVQNLHRREPQQGCEGLEIDQDGHWGRFSESGGAGVRVRGTILPPSLESDGSSPMIRRYQEPTTASRMNGSSSGAGDNHMISQKSRGHEVGVPINVLQN
jgi:hypothetical protein